MDWSSRCATGGTGTVRGSGGSRRAVRANGRLAVGPWWCSAQMREPGLRRGRRRHAFGSGTVGKAGCGNRGRHCAKATMALSSKHGRGFARGRLRSCARRADARCGYRLRTSGSCARWEVLCAVVGAHIRGAALCPAVRMEAACRRHRRRGGMSGGSDLTELSCSHGLAVEAANGIELGNTGCVRCARKRRKWRRRLLLSITTEGVVVGDGLRPLRRG